MIFFGLATFGCLQKLPSSKDIFSDIINIAIFAALTFWLYKKTQATRVEVESEKVHGFSSLGTAHADYPQAYQKNLDEYISIQKTVAGDDDYGKLKIVNTVDTGNNRGYFQTGVPSCKIHWLESTYKEKAEFMALLLTVEHFEDLDEAGGIMTLLYPAIRALTNTGIDDTVIKIAQFLSDKSVEQIQALQSEAETSAGTLTKVDRNEFKKGVLVDRIFDVELKTNYDVAADEVHMGFSILIVEYDTRKKYSVTREKVLGTA